MSNRKKIEVKASAELAFFYLQLQKQFKNIESYLEFQWEEARAIYVNKEISDKTEYYLAVGNIHRDVLNDVKNLFILEDAIKRSNVKSEGILEALTSETYNECDCTKEYSQYSQTSVPVMYTEGKLISQKSGEEFKGLSNIVTELQNAKNAQGIQFIGNLYVLGNYSNQQVINLLHFNDSRIRFVIDDYYGTDSPEKKMQNLDIFFRSNSFKYVKKVLSSAECCHVHVTKPFLSSKPENGFHYRDYLSLGILEVPKKLLRTCAHPVLLFINALIRSGTYTSSFNAFIIQEVQSFFGVSFDMAKSFVIDYVYMGGTPGAKTTRDLIMYEPQKKAWLSSMDIINEKIKYFHLFCQDISKSAVDRVIKKPIYTDNMPIFILISDILKENDSEVSPDVDVSLFIKSPVGTSITKSIQQNYYKTIHQTTELIRFYLQNPQINQRFKRPETRSTTRSRTRSTLRPDTLTSAESEVLPFTLDDYRTFITIFQEGISRGHNNNFDISIILVTPKSPEYKKIDSKGYYFLFYYYDIIYIYCKTENMFHRIVMFLRSKFIGIAYETVHSKENSSYSNSSYRKQQVTFNLDKSIVRHKPIDFNL